MPLRYLSEASIEHLDGFSTQTQTDRAMRYLSERSSRFLKDGVVRMFENRTDRRLTPSNTKNIRTAISFNKGGKWTLLKPPPEDSSGKKIDCPKDTCSLHLHGITDFDKFVPFYSYHNAVGIIMGTGNVGSYLSYD